ncbi:MAG: 8-amino-7-oxononanoate synthase [Sedimentisphaerales bacterium]|nr:8-amino-7-oxononanoate synthase [Sedimentisphaerales bacterium]
MENFDYLQTQLDQLAVAYLLRVPRCIEGPQGTIVTIDGEPKMLFCSNNYLSLANHPKVAEAVCKAAKQYGYGSAASRLISGTMTLHVELEQALAKLFQKESALVFPSGWTANEAILKTIPQKGDLVLLDKLDHASIIDAATSSDAEFKTYRRGTFDRLEKALGDKNYNRKFIVTESIFSMDGDTADLHTLVRLKKAYNAILIVDEAHAVGCLGATGAGLAEDMGLLDEVDIVVATMSKAFGASGGVVAAPKVVTDYLINKARSFIYTTAPTPVNCAAILAAIEILKTEPQRKIKLAENAAYLRDRLKKLGLNTGDSTSHIIPIIIGSEKDTLAISKNLFEKDFFVAAIRPPTVPPGTSRLRISLQADHTKRQIDALCDALSDQR